jgi:hypothetical protein
MLMVNARGLGARTRVGRGLGHGDRGGIGNLPPNGNGIDNEGRAGKIESHVRDYLADTMPVD